MRAFVILASALVALALAGCDSQADLAAESVELSFTEVRHINLVPEPGVFAFRDSVTWAEATLPWWGSNHDYVDGVFGRVPIPPYSFRDSLVLGVGYGKSACVYETGSGAIERIVQVGLETQIYLAPMVERPAQCRALIDLSYFVRVAQHEVPPGSEFRFIRQ
jgi:hypothetical protein